MVIGDCSDEYTNIDLTLGESGPFKSLKVMLTVMNISLAAFINVYVAVAFHAFVNSFCQTRDGNKGEQENPPSEMPATPAPESELPPSNIN